MTTALRRAKLMELVEQVDCLVRDAIKDAGMSPKDLGDVMMSHVAVMREQPLHPATRMTLLFTAYGLASAIKALAEEVDVDEGEAKDRA